jgi:hypothetical protein
VAIPEPKQSLIPECFDTSWYVRSILRSLVVPHFDGHLLASRPILMDGNARPHTDIVQDYLQQEAIELLPWSAMSPDMNPMKHLWDYLG